MENSDTKETGFSPPYNIPWSTFLHTVEKVAADLPDKIDRSYLSSRSGSEQSYLISAFRGFGLIRDDNVVTDELRELAKDADGRPERIRVLLERYYPQAIQLGKTNATPGQLDEAFTAMFPRVTGASRVKAMRFFLHAAEYAGIQRSPLWKAPKHGGGGGRRVGRRGTSGGSATGGAGVGNGYSPPSTEKAMKQAYFDLLLKKAEAQDELDTELLDRIEKLINPPEN